VYSIIQQETASHTIQPMQPLGTSTGLVSRDLLSAKRFVLNSITSLLGYVQKNMTAARASAPTTY